MNILLRVIGHINVLDLNLQSIRLCEHHRRRHQNHKHQQNNISLCHFKNNKTQPNFERIPSTTTMAGVAAVAARSLQV